MEQRNTDNVSKTANVLLVIIFLSVALFFGLKRIDLSLRETAVDNCSRISRFEQTLNNNATKVSYPLVEVYKQCLNDKGY